MYLHVNGDGIEVKARFLAELLDELGYEGDWLATAVNNELVTAAQRPTHRICENDRVEILSPMQGG